MEFAIRELENMEGIIKTTIDNLSEFETDTQEWREKLDDVQNAILVLNASKPIVNIGQIIALKNLQK